jgi:hypothetical protein
MLAELIENGLTFSPPDLDVEIQGRQLGGQYLIAIVDQGVGMDPEELAAANGRLRGEQHFLAAPTRFLGHYVIGRLAREMSVDVQLAPSPVTGVTARVLLSASLLARPPVIEPTHIDAPEPDPTKIVDHDHVHAFDRISPRPRPPGVPQPAAQRAIGVRPTPVVEFVTVGHADRPTTLLTAEVGSATPSPDGGTPATSVPRDATHAVDGRPSATGGDARTADGHVHAVGRAAAPPTATATPDGALTPTGVVTSEGPERTRNGLVKRVPRARAAQPGPVAAEQPGRAAPTDRSPVEMRSRLTSLRAGVQRGENARNKATGDAQVVLDHSADPERGTHDR